MAQTISKHIGEGFGKGELYAALAYDTTDQFGGMRIKRLYLAVPSGSTNAIRVNSTLAGAPAYYYGVQSNITKTGTDGIDDCTAVTAYLLQTTGAFTVTGRFAPLQALISGDGTVGVITKSGNGAVHAAWIANRGTQTNTDSILCVHNQSAATATSAIELDLDGTITNAFVFNGTVCSAFGHSDETTEFGAFDQCVKIPVKVEGESAQLYIMAAETWQSVD